MVDDDVGTLRAFNRCYTQRIGVLDDHFLGRGRSLGESRLLFEIGPDGAAVQDLRRRLGLDSGYLSRTLASLEQDGLITVVADPNDRRRRIVRLTPAGGQEWAELDARSDTAARDLLGPLSPGQRTRLTDALSMADRLLRAATVTFEAVDAHGDEAVAAMRRYFAEIDARFPSGFDPGDALFTGLRPLTPPTGAFVVARDDDRSIACGGVQTLADGVGEIKRMWVDPSWRGLGLGRRMLHRLEDVARGLGHTHVRLDTNSALTEAIAMYERAGYTAIDRYNDNPYAQRWFEKSLTPQA
jgi:DNA-binding MarR family transcriptional regulator/ribosomal protein S18 acetylase RimI-like enzyme